MERTINRVLRTWSTWDERQKEIQPAIGNGREYQAVLLRMKLAHFQKQRHLLSADTRPGEQQFMPLMDAVIHKMQKERYPNFLQRLLFRLKDRLIDGPVLVKAHARQRYENMTALKEQISASGFSDFAGKLEEKLDPGHQRHEVSFSSRLDRDSSLQVTLNFRNDGQDLIKFQSIDATIKNDLDPGLNRKFNFDLEEWPGLQAKAIKNLLEGRAVKQHFTNINGQPQSQWVALNLANNDVRIERYSNLSQYNLEQALAQLPFPVSGKAEMSQEVITQLEGGHRVGVHWLHNHQKAQVYLQADPAGGGIKLSDSEFKPVLPEQLNLRMERQQAQQQAKIRALPPINKEPPVGKRKKANIKI